MLSPQQEQALDKVNQWFKSRSKKPFILFGAAGTGKTTLAKHFAQGLTDKVFFAAFTGKAAHVLEKKGCPGARTIHSLIYKPCPRSRKYLKELERQALEGDGSDRIEKEIEEEKENLKSPKFILNEDSELKDAKLLILDECSMIPNYMGEDLLSFGCPILVLGDPHQLPPVKGTGFFNKEDPDFLLTEVHRQAADNPIIRLATDIRMYKEIHDDYGPEVLVTNKDYFVENVRPTIRPPTQVIVGKNKTRHRANDILREIIFGYTDVMPLSTDRVICLRNNHEKGLLNGAQFEVNNAWRRDDDNYIEMELFGIDEGDFKLVKCHPEIFKRQEVDYKYNNEAEHFDFANAITCHKAQGSEWDDVVVIDESTTFGHNARKWLYTAVTRASKTLVLVR